MTDTFNFWNMVLHSPVAIALAGGLAGSCITLAVALLRNSHDRKMRKEEWERSEITRKEERLFKLKYEAYEIVLINIDELPRFPKIFCTIQAFREFVEKSQKTFDNYWNKLKRVELYSSKEVCSTVMKTRYELDVLYDIYDDIIKEIDNTIELYGDNITLDSGMVSDQIILKMNQIGEQIEKINTLEIVLPMLLRADIDSHHNQ